MSKKHRLSLIHPTVEPSTVASPPPTKEETSYGWKPTHAREQIPVNPYDSWLIYQASSYYGRRVGLDEARELFSRIDVHTRQPIQPPAPKSFWERFVEKLA